MIGAFLSSGGVTENPVVEMNLVLVIWVAHHKVESLFLNNNPSVYSKAALS